MWVKLGTLRGKDGLDGLHGHDGLSGAAGKPGKDGRDGISITDVEQRTKDSFTIILSDKTEKTFQLPKIKGKGVAGGSGQETYFRSGNGAPNLGVGVLGDHYLDKDASLLYGPKTGSGWGVGVSLSGGADKLNLDGSNANQDIDIGAYSLSAAAIKVNGTNGNGHIHLKHQASDAASQANSTTLFADSAGDLKWKIDSLYYTTFITSGNTADRSYTFPDASGTVALTSDLSSYVPTSRTITINGTAYDLSADRSWTISTGMTNPMTTLGDIIYEDATPTPARLAGNTTTTQKFLGQVGNGSVSAAPTWFDLYNTAATWGARQTLRLETIQPASDADDVWRLNNAAGTRRMGYSTSKSQFYFADAAPNSTYGLFYIADVTHSFKPVFRVDKYTWGSLIEGSVATDSPVFNITGGSNFVTWSRTNTATALANSAQIGMTLTVRDDYNNYGTWGGYGKGYNNNSAPSVSGASKRGVSYGLVGEAQSNATGNGGAGLRSYSASANIDGVRVDVLSGQTAPLLRARTVNSLYDANMTVATDIMTIEADGSIKNDGTNKWIFKGHTSGASVAVDTTQYVTVNIGGTDYKLAVVT